MNYLKQKLFVVDTTLAECIESLEIIMKRHFLTIYDTFEDYVSKQLNKSRIIYILIIKMMLNLDMIQFSMPIIIKEVGKSIMFHFVSKINSLKCPIFSRGCTT